MATLPLILAQCNAVISLVDDTYYDRAWCSVEALLVQTLKKSYGIHLWYEHVPLLTDRAGVESNLINPAGTPVRRWKLQDAQKDQVITVADKKLSKPEDRDKVRFLERQSKFLGSSKRRRS